jgi:hypothetical protein
MNFGSFGPKRFSSKEQQRELRSNTEYPLKRKVLQKRISSIKVTDL